jgi:cation transport regulator ChaC
MKLPLFNPPQVSTASDFHWFVYGSTLDFDAFTAWCGDHGYLLPDLTRARPATLRGWRLVFNVRSNFWGGAVGSLVEDPSSSVEGLAIPLPASALALVRHKEGVVSGLFEERTAHCELAEGHRVECKVFVANPARTVEEETPAPRFLQTMLKGARDRGLPSEWTSALQQRAR